MLFKRSYIILPVNFFKNYPQIKVDTLAKLQTFPAGLKLKKMFY